MKKLYFATLLFTSLSFFGKTQLGTIDPNFTLGTGFGPDQWTGNCETIVQQADGKLIVGGYFTEFNGNSAVRLVRLNLDGTIDASFQTGGGFTGVSAYVKALAIQSDGKILVGGNFLEFDGVTRHRIARLNADGSLDTSFDPLTGFDSDVNTIQVQADGKILVGGVFTKYDWLNSPGIDRNRIARLNADGSLDASFNPGDGITSTAGQARVHEIILQDDGKILACGLFTNYHDQIRTNVVRINSDGSIDPTLDASADFTEVFGFYGEAWDMELLSDGRIQLAGNFHYTASGNGICRLNSNGSTDPSFNLSSGGFTSLALQSDGKYIVTTSGPYIVKRFNEDGTQDSLFPETTLNDWAKKTIVQNDGNITFVGHFSYNPNGIMRLLGDTPASVGLNDMNTNRSIVYPNPATNHITIANISQASEIIIRDMRGAVVYTTISSSEQESINTAKLKRGMYTVEIQHDNTKTAERLILH